MAIEHNLIARTTAGRAAVIVMHEHGQEIGADMLFGMVAGFVTACAEVSGWDQTLASVNELARAARVPAAVEKPRLSIVSGEGLRDTIAC